MGTVLLGLPKAFDSIPHDLLSVRLPVHSYLKRSLACKQVYMVKQKKGERQDVNDESERTHQTYLTFQLQQQNTRQDKGE